MPYRDPGGIAVADNTGIDCLVERAHTRSTLALHTSKRPFVGLVLVSVA
jgi:hypothetical protein